MLKSKYIVPILIVDHIAPDTIILNEKIFKEQHIPRAQHITIQFGIHTRIVKVLPTPKKQGLSMHPKLAQQLGILGFTGQRLQLRVQYMEKLTTLKLGPLISVLINKETPENISKPFGNISSFCHELAEACMKHGAAVYFFTPLSITSQSTWLNGWVYDGEWKKRMLPLAEVIYNRLPSRKVESQSQVQLFFRHISKQHNIAIFNERFLDKHDVFHSLKNDDEVNRYLPESHLLENLATLKEMYSKYRVLYLKPVQGSLGRGIYRITALEQQKMILLESATSNSSKPMKFSSLTNLYRVIKPKLKIRQYQLQQGLSVIQIGPKPVDFRALVQKNATGKWSITSIVARTAGDEKFVANLASGGTIDTVINTLPRTNLLKHLSPEEMLLSLRRASISIAEAIDRNIEAHFGELGIDLAIDVQGNVWLLEVNSKPSKQDNTPLQGTRIRPSVRMVISYAKYLTGIEEGRNPHGQHKSRSSSSKN